MPEALDISLRHTEQLCRPEKDVCRNKGQQMVPELDGSSAPEQTAPFLLEKHSRALPMRSPSLPQQSDFLALSPHTPNT